MNETFSATSYENVVIVFLPPVEPLIAKKLSLALRKDDSVS